MTEQEWLQATDLWSMLELLRGKASVRKMRLMVCAYCRQVWHLLSDPGSRHAVEVAESFADRRATAEQLMACRSAARATAKRAARAVHAGMAWYAALAVSRAASSDAYESARQLARDASLVSGGVTLIPALQGALSAQAVLLRELVGNPFRPVTVSPAVLAWNDRLVVRLAQAAYNERHLPEGTLDPARLAVLSDALEEAGAALELVAHLRQPGPHVRGCAALDAVLGRS